MAFCGRTAATDTVNSELGLGWWTSNESALLRRASNAKGEHRFIPLFTLREKVKRSLLPSWWPRGESEPEPSVGEYV